MKKLFIFVATLALNMAVLHAQDLEALFEDVKNGARIDLSNPDHRTFFQIYLISNFKYPTRMANLKTKIKAQGDFVRGQNLYDTKIKFDHFEIRTNTQNYEKNEASETMFSELWEFRRHMLVSSTDNPAWKDVDISEMMRILSASYEKAFGESLSGIERNETRIKKINTKLKDQKNIDSWYKALAEELFSSWRKASGKQATNLEKILVNLIKTYGLREANTKKTFDALNVKEQLLFLEKSIQDEGREFSIEILKKQSLYAIYDQKVRGSIRQIAGLRGKLKPTVSAKEVFRFRLFTPYESGYISLVSSHCSTEGEDGVETHSIKPLYAYAIEQEDKVTKGMITFVLGTAEENGRRKKVAVIEQVDDIPNEVLPKALESIRRIVKKYGYELAILDPIRDGSSSVSNTSSHNETLENSFAVKNSKRLLESFVPEEHRKPRQVHSDSRIYESPNVLVLEEMPLPENDLLTEKKNPQSQNFIEFNLADILDETKTLLLNLSQREVVNESSAKDLLKFLKIANGLSDLDIPELNGITEYIFSVAPKVFGHYQNVDVEMMQLFEKSNQLNKLFQLLIEKSVITPQTAFKFSTNYAQFLWKVEDYNFVISEYTTSRSNQSKTPIAAYLHILAPLLDGYLRTPSVPSWIGSYYGAVHNLSEKYSSGLKNNPMTLSYALSIWFGNAMKSFVSDPTISDGQKLEKINAIKAALDIHYKSNKWATLQASPAEILVALTHIFQNKTRYNKLGSETISIIKGLTGMQQGRKEYSLDPLMLHDVGLFGITTATLEILFALENIGFDTRVENRFPGGEETSFAESYDSLIEDGVIWIESYYKAAGSQRKVSTKSVHRRIAERVGEIKKAGFWDMEAWSYVAGESEYNSFVALVKSDPSETYLKPDKTIDWDAVFKISSDKRMNGPEDYNSGLAGGLGVKLFERFDAFLWSLIPNDWKSGINQLPQRLRHWVMQQFSQRVALTLKKLKKGEKELYASEKEIILRIVNADNSVNPELLKPTDLPHLTSLAQTALVEPVEESMEKGNSNPNNTKDFNAFKAEFKKTLEKGMSGKAIALQQLEFVMALWVIKFVEKLSDGLSVSEAMASAAEDIFSQEHVNGLLGFVGASTAFNMIGFQALRKAIDIKAVAQAMKFPIIQKLTIQLVNSGSLLTGMYFQNAISNLSGLEAIRAMAIKRYPWAKYYEKLSDHSSLPPVFGSLAVLSKEGGNAPLWEPHFTDINYLMRGFDPDYKNKRVGVTEPYNYVFLQKLKLQLMNRSDLRAKTIKRFNFKEAAQDTAIVMVSHLSANFLTRGMPGISTILTLSMVGLIKSVVSLEEEKISNVSDYQKKQAVVNKITKKYQDFAKELYIPMELKESDVLNVEPFIEEFEVLWPDLENELRKRIYMVSHALGELQAHVQEKLGVKIQQETYATSNQLTSQEMKKIEQALLVVSGQLEYQIGERWQKGLPMCEERAIYTSHEYLGREYEKHLEALECQVAMLRFVANRMRSIVRDPNSLTQKLEKMISYSKDNKNVRMNDVRTIKPLEFVIIDHYIRMSQSLGMYEDVSKNIRETLTEMRHLLPIMVVHRSMEANEESKKPRNAYVEVQQYGNHTRIISTIPDKEFALSSELLTAVYSTSNMLIDWKKVKRSIYYDEMDSRFEMSFDFKNLREGQNYYLKVFALDNKEGESPSFYLNIPFKTKSVRGRSISLPGL